MCVLTRRRAPQATLFRLGLGPDGVPFVDLLGRAPGHGVYVEPGSLPEVLTPKGLARAFKGKARSLDEDEAQALVAGTAERLTARIEDILGLARRAGGLALGMDATCRQLSGDGDDCLVLLASDLAERTVQKVTDLTDQPRAGPSPQIVCASTKAGMGRALGRETVGVVAVWHPVFRKRLENEAARLTALNEARNRH